MPILSSIQRRSPGGKFILGIMYALLTFGAAWMVYPFLLLLSGSVKSATDIRHFDIIPKYLYDDLTLFQKFEEQRYGTQLDAFNAAARQGVFSFEHITEPPKVSDALMRDWDEFWGASASWSKTFRQLGHNFGMKTVPEVRMEYQRRLTTAFPGISKQEFNIWLTRPEDWPSRMYQPARSPFTPVYDQMRGELALRYFRPVTVEGAFIMSYLRPTYGTGADGVKKLNEKWGTKYKSIYEVTLSPVAPSFDEIRWNTLGPDLPFSRALDDDWWNFVRKSLSSRFLSFAPSLLPDYRKFLQAKYQDVAALNKVYETSHATWADVAFPGKAVETDRMTSDLPPVAFADLEEFVEGRKSPLGISIDAPEFRWRDFLRKKYQHDPAAMNRAFGTTDASFDLVPMPVFEDDWRIMKANRGAIVWDYLTRNYRIVWDYLSVQGNGLKNTAIFCLLNVLTALIVNPLAAYALSRFQPRWGYKVMFLLMATMAFPAEVTQIPAFLMLREMGMLNTFAALIIPAAANGYSIFILKGFFDSLPKELYESATIDGAGEARIFTTITMPLSSPILAYTALGAFTSAYGAFMFALLVCQKESMWTLMVYIYQLQQFYGAPIIFASLVLAAIPTLLVFVFCQNIIMKGIVVPVEK